MAHLVLRRRFLYCYWLPCLSLLVPQPRTFALLSRQYSIRPPIKGSRLLLVNPTDTRLRPSTALMVGPTKKKASTAAKSGKRKASKKKSEVSDATASDSDTSSTPAAKKAKPSKPKKAPKHQVLTTRDAIPKLWDASKNTGSYSTSRNVICLLLLLCCFRSLISPCFYLFLAYKMATWNVARC